MGKAIITNPIKQIPKNGLVEISIKAYNQNDDLILTDLSEAVFKYKVM